ncbi:aldehyde dehydrogenase family protein [Aquihabitans sp. G128]|uniref:L-piperidine-6-carboxylate dehydrogenase n=1 Tax=Aquihabitans sp. G128 TaxID=2849779 RepID=UPI001C236C25|nr:aldehyde dehydrogenase family protein [Aquihabitans sp. G128]QXC61008.1 aldehyde dehydrogenase family protein [Aquihabitans sp. G128]
MTLLPSPSQLDQRARALAATLGVDAALLQGPGAAAIALRSPITGVTTGSVAAAAVADVHDAVDRASEAFTAWRTTPAPVRGELVRRFGLVLRARKDELGELVSIEAGKIRSEGQGEVQEMIDICDLAVGQSRQLFGKAIASERPGHRMAEAWHPLGVVGIISAFNFPVAVWAWNAALALVCGDPVVWKPSDRTPLTALACQALLERAAAEVDAPAHLSQVVLGGAEAGDALAAHPAVALLSATGSTAMGRQVAARRAPTFGRTLLELGGNNAAVITGAADLDLAVRAVTFSAAGTAGQRCTTLRRIIVHRSVHDELVQRVADAFERLPIGDPLAAGTLVGPVIDGPAADRIAAAIAAAQAEGAKVVVGGHRVLADEAPEARYLAPALVTIGAQSDLVRTETFGPLLYALAYDDLDEAIALNNDVPQGLSSSIFTTDLREAERFCGPAGSDCGIANVNIGPSGAEIGGAFGGEKDTGGGRESGSDAWQAYVRRTTTTVNYSDDLPLAQGVEFA